LHAIKLATALLCAFAALRDVYSLVGINLTLEAQSRKVLNSDFQRRCNAIATISTRLIVTPQVGLKYFSRCAC
jgi:hypothetical protein